MKKVSKVKATASPIEEKSPMLPNPVETKFVKFLFDIMPK